MAHKKTKIIVAENKELLRKGLVALLKNNPDFQVVDEASNGRDLLEQLKQEVVDIVLLETTLPIMDGKTVLDIIHRRFPYLKVILLSEQSNAQLQSDYMARGANGFLSKSCELETLFKAIEKVKTEGFFFDNATSRALLEKIVKDKQRSGLSGEINLNERETEILKKICDGRTNKEIAVNLNLSTSTIDFYKTKIYGKTKCNNSTGLLKYALRNGLVELT